MRMMIENFVYGGRIHILIDRQVWIHGAVKLYATIGHHAFYMGGIYYYDGR